jgi:hypothetical protein
MSSGRINEIRRLLNQLASNPIFTIPRFSDQVFEVYCYLKKVEEFKQMGRTPICIQRTNGVFRPLHKPGLHRTNGDYFRLLGNNQDKTMDIFLNGTFTGQSGINHSPDIALTERNNDKVISFYECKNYSRCLGPGVYREMIGYCNEFKYKKSGFSDYVNAFTPAIYTSATADSIHVQKMKEKYNVIINDLQ